MRGRAIYLFYEFVEEETTHHFLSISNDENNTQFEYKVFTTDMSNCDFNQIAQWLEDYSELKSSGFYIELQDMMLSVGGRGARNVSYYWLMHSIFD